MLTIIMAGGKGTRISELFPNIPKPMIKVAGVPIIEREILSLREQGFLDFIITVSYLGDVIMDYLGDGEKIGVKIKYFVEDQPLGNAGALFKLREYIGKEPFLLLNADAMFDVDFNRMVSFHEKHEGWVTLFTHPNSHPYDSGLIISDKDGRVEKWLAKEEQRPNYYNNRVNAGLHIIDPKVLDLVDIDVEEIGKEDINGNIIKVDLDRDVLKPLQGTGRMYCYDSPEYVKDMGTPERFYHVEQDYINGIVCEKNLKNRQKAIFLDRDGTINKYKGFIREPKELELVDGIEAAIEKINASGYLCIVITNQPVIARGEVSMFQLDEIHKKLETELGKKGAYIDALYYCPHHPHRGYEGEVAELKVICKCRKPEPGLILKAAEDYNIDLDNSFMVGDSKEDILAGLSAKCKAIMINGSDAKGEDGDFGQLETMDSVLSFVEKYIVINKI